MIVQAGATDVTTYFVLRTAADGTATTGATITSLDLQYVRSGAAPSVKADATALAAVDSIHSDNQAIEIDATDQPGLYRVDWPDAAFAAGVSEVILTVKLASSFTEHLRVELSPAVDAVAISGDSTAADNLEAACDGGSYNVGGGSVVAASVTGAVGSVSGAVGSVTGNVDGSVASVTGAVGSVTGNVGGSVASVTADVTSDLVKIHGSALTETAGQLAGRFVDFFNQASAGYNVATALSSFKATSVTVSDKTGFKLASDGLNLQTAWTTDITGSLSGSVGSVSGAVGSVTGAVGSVTADVTSDLVKIHGVALTEAVDGYLAAAFVKLFDVATPLLVASDVMVGTSGASTHSAADVWTAGSRELSTPANYKATGFSTHVAADIWTAGSRSLSTPNDYKATGFAVAGDLMLADITKIHGVALTETVDGYLAAAFVKLFDVATPLLVASDVMVGTSGASTHSAADVWTAGSRELSTPANYKATGFSTHSAADVWTAGSRALTDKAGFSLAADQSAVTIGTVTTVTNGVGLADDAITAAKYDEWTAFPLALADSGADAVARTGADADTLEDLSDEIALLNDVSSAVVQAAAAAALAAIHLDHLFETDTDTLPGNSGAVMHDLLEDDGGTWRLTANALEGVFLVDMDQVEASAPVHSLCCVVLQQAVKSDTTSNAGFLTVFATNGTTEFVQLPLSTTADAEAVDGIG